MKKLLLLFLVIFGFTQVKADTIDYWHVYYNKIKMGDFVEYFPNRPVLLKLANIKPTDTISLKYFRNTPCYDCLSYIIVEDESHHIVVTGTGKGTANPVSFSVQALTGYKNNPKSIYTIFYFEGDMKDAVNKRPVFSILLE